MREEVVEMPGRKPEKIKVYTVKEAAEALGVHPDTVRRWGNAGRIKEYRSYGGENQRLYPVDEVERIAKLLQERERLRNELWGDDEGEDEDGTETGP